MDQHQTLAHAQIIPPGPDGGAGVCAQDGRFVPESAVQRGDEVLHRPAQPAANAPFRSGTHLYGGSLSWHFGHFLVESLARLWPLGDPALHVDSILFFPRRAARAPRVLQPYHHALFEILAPGLRVECVTEPITVERLIVPEQGFGMGALEAGTPDFRAFIRSRSWPEPSPSGASRLYVSRAALRRQRGHILGDAALSEVLAAQGFEVFHPEQHDIRAQIGAYRAAQRLIFDDGSALHLFGLVARTGQTVASLQRRFCEDRPVGVRQLRSFAGLDLKVMDCVRREWRPAGATGSTSKSDAELDARHLLAALDGFGAVPEGAQPADLGLPDAAGAEAQMVPRGYTPVARPTALPEPPAIAQFWGIDVPDGPHLDRRKLRSLRDGFYERQEVLAGMSCLRPEDRLLELGAGSGLVGAAVMHNSGAARSLSFEANPGLIEPARALYARNGLDTRMTVAQAILTADATPPDTLDFGVAPDYLGSRLLSADEAPDPGMEVVPVPTRPFAEVVAAFQPTALMMDIEGGELDILETCDLSGFRVIVVELHRGIYGRDGMRRCRFALSRAGFVAVPDHCRRGVDTWARPD